MARKFRDLVQETKEKRDMEHAGNAVAGAAVALAIMTVVYGLIIYVYSVV